jgi:hypothetical protein
VNGLKHLTLFFVLGLGLFGLKRVFRAEPARPVLVVQVRGQASAEEIERAVDEAVLVDQGLGHGGALLDPIVRDQILRSMRVSNGADEENEQELLDRALSLGVHRADPLIRKRLAFQAEQLLRSRVHADPPGQAELERYLNEHVERYRKPARVSFTHVFISRSRHADDLAETVQHMGARLSEQRPPAGEAFRYSEPTILPLEVTRATDAELASRFGGAFAKTLAEAPMDVWHGPISSSYGEHFVQVTLREPARLGSLEELRTRLMADRDRDLKTASVAREVRSLRQHYRIEVRSESGEPEVEARGSLAN